MKGISLLISFLSILIIVSVLAPNFSVGKTTTIKPDLLFVFFALPFLALFSKRVFKLPLSRSYVLIGVFLFFSMSFSDSFGKINFLDGKGFSLSIRYIYIFFKIATFILFLYVSFYNRLSYKFFVKISSIVFVLAMSWGVLQFFEIANARQISADLYAISDGQAHGIISFNRIFGTAPAIISWAGFCIMVFYFFFYIVSTKLFKILGASLAVFNVMGAASRSAIAALIISFVLIQLFRAVYLKRSVISLVKIIVTCLTLMIGTYTFMKLYLPDRIEYLEKRFETAEDDITVEGRGAQVDFFFSILNAEPIYYFFGLGHPVVQDLSFLEIDPAFILVCFGLVGFILHYLLIFLLVKRAFKLRKQNQDLFLFILSSTLGYLIFSLGFFFLSELYMGLPYWWLNGFFIGYLYRQKVLASHTI